MEQILQGIGLIVVLCFIAFSLDDLVWDISGIIRKIRRREADRLAIEHLDALPPKLLAVMVAAWHEDNVIEEVVDNMVSSLQYPSSMYHIFLGVYPNDEPTVDAAKRLSEKFPNVHTVIHVREGPTCKADNVNNIIQYIKDFESACGWRFSSVTLHDSEDVIHPYELKLTNYLLDHYDVLQFPIIPLQRMPTLKNIFKGMTIGTYADEFAENHYRTMGTREAMDAMVPSAGTGYVLSHKILDAFEGEPLFPEDSLTEDYKLSLILAKRGFDTHFVLEKVPRLMDNHTVRWDYVATRSFFPDTFKAAVRQKTRWIYGITMQSAKISEMFQSSRLGFAGRFSLYKDLKAKLSNLIVLPGYLAFTYCVLSFFLPLPYMYPEGTLGYHLSICLTFIMVFRQLMRAVSISNFYGARSMAVACLLPPLLPIRLIWGNIINMAATWKAWKLFIRGSGAKKTKKKVAWSKTDHTFLKKQDLFRYYRNIGDILLEKQYIDVSALSTALEQSKREGMRIGDILLNKGLVTEEQLLESAAAAQHKIFVKNIAGFASELAGAFDREMLKELLVYPILHRGAGYVFAVAEASETGEALRALGMEPANCRFVYTTKSSILAMIESQSDVVSPAYRTVDEHFQAGGITWEQAVLAMDWHDAMPDVLAYMGLRDTGRAIEVEEEFAAPVGEEIPATING